jgi:hypothetical protein
MDSVARTFAIELKQSGFGGNIRLERGRLVLIGGAAEVFDQRHVATTADVLRASNRQELAGQHHP